MSRVLCSDVSHHLDAEVSICGWVEVVRSMGALSFLVVRDRSGCVQVVWEGRGDLPATQSVVSISGTAKSDRRAPGGAEIIARSLIEVSRAESPLPVDFDGRCPSGLDALLEHRVLSLRSRRSRAMLKIKSEFTRAFREFLRQEGFTEVHTPKIVATGTEGGAELFSVGYFGKKAYLAQSPQLYKQMLVSTGLERVFEVGPVFRAEEHNTSRHTNEFTSLDLEMGFIDDVEDVMALEERFLKAAVEHLREYVHNDLEQNGWALPEIKSIPRLDVDEARHLVKKRLGLDLPEGDLGAEGERAAGQAVLEETGEEFCFITGYPESIRPFYAMPDKERPGKTRSFDLLFRGSEITTGGQRIHSHSMLVEKMTQRGLDPTAFGGYLEAFRFGMPPHGGLAIGLERFVMKLMGFSNIREACTFVRDRTRLEP